jgi:hypothetical protein
VEAEHNQAHFRGTPVLLLRKIAENQFKLLLPNSGPFCRVAAVAAVMRPPMMTPQTPEAAGHILKHCEKL